MLQPRAHLYSSGPPVLLGAMSKGAAKRIAEYCDGWFPVDGPYDLTKGIEALRAEAARVGRSMDEFDLGVITAYALAGGSGDESRIRKLIQAGFNRVLVLIEPGVPDAQWPVLERYAGLIRTLR